MKWKVSNMLQQYKNILAPIDGSKVTDTVLKKAIEVAKRNDTHLDILNVLEVNQFSDTYGVLLAATSFTSYPKTFKTLSRA